MAGRGYRSGCLALAACLALGLAPLPLHAAAPTGLDALTRAEILGARRVSYFRLAGVNGLIIHDERSPRTSLLVLAQPKSPQVLPAAELGKRFVEAFGLQKLYSVAPAGDGGPTVFLVGREARKEWGYRGEAAEQALLGEQGLMPIINWLHAALQVTPHSLRGGRLVWRKRAPFFKDARSVDIEFALNLTGGMPALLELHVSKPGGKGEEDGLSTLLDMDLKAPDAKKARSLRKEFGYPVLAAQGGIYLVQTGKDNYLLGSRKALRVARRGPKHVISFRLPDVAETAWPESEPAPPSLWEESPPPSKGSGHAAEPPSADKPSASPAAPTPAQARELYIRRLKAL